MSAPEKHETGNSRVLLLGLGNDILSDDAIGLFVVRALAGEFKNTGEIDVRETTEMGLALLDFLVGYETTLIVDSIKTGRCPPGTVHVLDPANVKKLDVHSPHFLGVGETLALGEQLGLAMPIRVKIAAVEVEDPFTIGTKLTPRLSAAFPDIVGRVRCLLQEMIAATDGKARFFSQRGPTNLVHAESEG